MADHRNERTLQPPRLAGCFPMPTLARVSRRVRLLIGRAGFTPSGGPLHALPHACPTDSRGFAHLSISLLMKLNPLRSTERQEMPGASPSLRHHKRRDAASTLTGQLGSTRSRQPALHCRTSGLAVLIVLSGATLFVAQAATGTEPSQTGLSSALNADSLGAVLAPLVSALGGKFGAVVQGLTVMAVLRTLFKPIMAALEAAVADNPTQAVRLLQFERSTAFRAVAFVLDLLTSIKLHLVTPPPAHPGTNPTPTSRPA